MSVCLHMRRRVKQPRCPAMPGSRLLFLYVCGKSFHGDKPTGLRRRKVSQTYYSVWMAAREVTLRVESSIFGCGIITREKTGRLPAGECFRRGIPAAGVDGED